MKLLQLNEGIRKVSGTFQLDLDNDQEDDIVKLVGINNVREKQTQWHKVKIYYSFKVNTSVTTRSLARDLARHLKTDPADSDKFLDLAVEHFIDNYAAIADIDLITYPQSGSDFNKRLAEKLAYILDAQVIHSGFVKKTLGDASVRPETRGEMYQFRKAQLSEKENAFDQIKKYLFNQALDRDGRHVGQYYRIAKPDSAETGEKNRYDADHRSYFAPMIRLLIQIKKLFTEIEQTDPKLERLDELVDLTANYWAEREAFKLERAIRNQVGKNKVGQKQRPTQIKNIIGKDKREFLDFLNISTELEPELDNYNSVLVVDDNTDYGGTFSRIHQILGKMEGLEVHYYAPLLMTVDENALRKRERALKPKPKIKKLSAPRKSPEEQALSQYRLNQEIRFQGQEYVIIGVQKDPTKTLGIRAQPIIDYQLQPLNKAIFIPITRLMESFESYLDAILENVEQIISDEDDDLLDVDAAFEEIKNVKWDSGFTPRQVYEHLAENEPMDDNYENQSVRFHIKQLQNGNLQSIEVDDDGVTDGYHRITAAKVLGIRRLPYRWG